MKARRFFALFIIFALSLSIGAHADVVSVPDVDFFYDHSEECEIHNKVYYTNGTDGYVIGYSTPTGKGKVAIPNGKELFVSALWLGDRSGTIWGCIEYEPESFEYSINGEDAWVDMSSMYRRYESDSFMAEHASAISSEEYVLRLNKGDKVFVYSYPGSGEIHGWISENGIDSDYRDISLNALYTDTENRRWGHLSYYQGFRDLWVCIDEPDTELPAGAEYHELQLITAASAEELENVSLPDGGLSGSVIAGAVGLLVIAAAVVAYIVLKNRRGK